MEMFFYKGWDVLIVLKFLFSGVYFELEFFVFFSSFEGGG